MSNRPGTAALVEALRDWRRNVGAVLFVFGVLAVAALLGSKEAYYTASLLVFTAWMAWFVLTCIEWVRLAEF